MKTISKFYRLASPFLMPVIITSSLALPVSAMEPTTAPTKTKESTSNSACVRIATLETTSEAAVSSKKATMQTDFSNRLASITSNQHQVDQKVAAFRANLAASFNARVAKLEAEKGITDTQKTAIETFKTNMQAAETTREKAVDTARQTYRSGLSQAISGRQTALTNAVATYQATVDSAFSTAAANCSDSGAMQTLKTTIKSARDALQTTRSDNKIDQTISQLATTRNASIKTADQAFAQSAASYGQALAAALSTSGSTSPVANPSTNTSAQ